MLLLTSTSDLLQVVTGSNPAGVSVDVHASWLDFADAGTRTPGRTNTSISSATTATVVSSPAASTQRNVKRLTVYNQSSLSQDVTIKHTNGVTAVELFKTSLAVDEVVSFDEEGFRVFDANGNLKIS